MKVSVITINFNNKIGLQDTVRSVVSQSYPNMEYIIIDGGSTDGSKEVLEDNKQNISYWVSEPDKGIYNAMNKGIAKATGEYCIFMNSGDCFVDENTVKTVFEKSINADIICGNTVFSGGHVIPAKKEITFDSLFENAICHQSCFIRTSLMQKYGYDESLRIVADRKFFIQALILDNCTYYAVDVNVAKYDITGFSSQNPVASRLEYTKVLEELIPERIRIDYGRQRKGALYGDSAYNKLFAEIGLRKYRKPIYLMTSLLLRTMAVFKKSASFIKDFPVKL